jgi:hypothetical protein
MKNALLPRIIREAAVFPPIVWLHSACHLMIRHAVWCPVEEGLTIKKVNEEFFE